MKRFRKFRHLSLERKLFPPSGTEIRWRGDKAFRDKFAFDAIQQAIERDRIAQSWSVFRISRRYRGLTLRRREINDLVVQTAQQTNRLGN